eukprot:3395665-Amphidinium_carterae.1
MQLIDGQKDLMHHARARSLSRLMHSSTQPANFIHQEKEGLDVEELTNEAGRRLDDKQADVKEVDVASSDAKDSEKSSVTGTKDIEAVKLRERNWENFDVMVESECKHHAQPQSAGQLCKTWLATCPI